VLNEVGCYFPSGVPLGRHSITYKFIVVPPTKFDGARYHLNLKLAEEHISYTRFSVEIPVSRSEIERIYVHTPDYSVKMLEDKIKG